MRHTHLPRFEELTETTGIPLSPEGARMMYTRYRVASELAAGQRVLELGCGAGQGLGLVGAGARSIVGGDFSWPLLEAARKHYGDRIPLVRLTAESLPFADGVFDLVLFFEASYYVPAMESAFSEIARVLAPAARVMFVNANPERRDFISSPHSVQYHTADEFRTSLEKRGFVVHVEGAFPMEDDHGQRSVVIGGALSLARRLLEALGLVPRTLRGRARIKRLLYGRSLTAVPSEVQEGFAELASRTTLQRGPVRGHKVLYVTATRPAPATSTR